MTSRADMDASSLGFVPYIPLDRTSRVPLYRQIYEGCRHAIVSGRILPGERLPSTRALAAAWDISRFPIITAFELLLQEGYVEGRMGSGTFVSQHIPKDFTSLTPLARPAQPPNPAGIQPAWDGTSLGDRSGPFAVGMPALDQFPSDIWARLVRRHARLAGDVLAGADPKGHLPLRRSIAAYLRVARAVDCDPRQVLIVSGSQVGLRVVATALRSIRRAVCVEDPSYRVAQRTLEQAQVEVIPVSVDREGLDVAKLELLGDRVKAVYATPSSQYPLGMPMSTGRRTALLDWAARHDGWIIEDDYGCEFRYSGVPVPSLQGMRPSSRVAYLGTFSNVLFPGLCMGYVVVPPELVSACLRTLEALQRNSQTLAQYVLADFLDEGHLARHLRRMQTVYFARRNALIDAIRNDADDFLTLGHAEAGLHLVGFLPDTIDDREVVRRAGQHGLFPLALSECYARPNARRGLILGYGGSNETVIAGAVRTLASVIKSVYYT